MKGTWVVEEATDTWHLGWNHTNDEPARGNDIQSSWCRKGFPLGAPTINGSQITWAHTVHDECLRKSEEIE